ncbi:serine hydrolase domain-containing protein [Actinophytocola oryzae]|uniref:CubicO group peptidase (Beta-lactamase class C family) n=1 Tax=Actinophytocola oryzae TaxID=502181 RepID=A0A4R7VL63_9PSEU|nr:serine hydrolase [Actinophytocola oryzae]TDV49978.1 CubicO group peptidase (beta-lactamase class C family) [Actinophytocola oryzae]
MTTVNDEATIGLGPVHALLRELADRGMRLHSLLVHRRGRTVLELWQWPHAPSLRHKLHSATKSFTGTAVGFAEAEGLLGLDDPVAGFFPRLPAGADLRGMRVRDLLTMRTGHGRGLSGATTRLRTTGWVEEFLAEPVVEPPGHTFMYDSSASHVLSAIVQEVSGLPVDEYLRPRLFDPLGIEDVEWERDPDGVCGGGNGLSLRPRDLLSFGVLYLRDGWWAGERVLPEGWARRASAPHVRHAAMGTWNGREFGRPGADAVADSGYGYQFWTTEDRIHNASGIFGQECMVFPDQDGVVVVTGAMGDGTYHDLPEMLRTTFRSALRGEGADDAAAEAVYRLVLRAREPEPVPATEVPTGVEGTYHFAPNEHGLRSLTVERKDGAVLLGIADDRGEHAIEHGLGHWVRQRTGVSVWRLHHSYQDTRAVIVAAARWSTDELALTWHFLESPFIDQLRLSFDEDGVTVAHEVNVNGGPTVLPPVRGVRS